MTWWPALAASLGLWALIWTVVAGEVAADERWTSRVVYVPRMPRISGLNVVPGLILVDRSQADAWDPWRRYALVAHERVHDEQMARDGFARWLARYVFSVCWRIEYEAEAYATNILWREARGERSRAVLVEVYARHILADYCTGWPPWSEVPSRAAVESMIRRYLP